MNCKPLVGLRLTAGVAAVAVALAVVVVAAVSAPVQDRAPPGPPKAALALPAPGLRTTGLQFTGQQPVLPHRRTAALAFVGQHAALLDLRAPALHFVGQYGAPSGLSF